VQRLVDTDKRPRLVWSVTRDTNGTVRAMWQTPTDVDPKQGLVLDIGDGKPRTVPFAACAEQYCLVRGILAPAYLTTLASVGRATVALNSKTGQATSYAFALTGLADGLAWLGGR
jgi:invasion protein IalB